MAFDFPSSPAIGQEANGYQWDGEKWIVIGSDVPDDQFLPLAGGTLSGPLTLAGPPTVDLHAATKAYVDGKVFTIDIGQFGPVGTANDLATFQAALAFANSYGSPIVIKMRSRHTITDNTAADGFSLLAYANHVYWQGADGGTFLTLNSTSTFNRSFFLWYGGVSGSYTLASNAAANATAITFTSGASWAAGDFIYCLQQNDGSGHARSFIREVKGVAGATITLKDAIPFAIATTHTLLNQRIPGGAGGFIVGGGFLGDIYFDGAGVTGDNTRAVNATIVKQWRYENLSFENFKGTTPISGGTAAMFLDVGYDNRGGHLRLKNSGSGSFADVSYAKQCFGTFGDITDEAPAGFGPVIGEGSRSSFGNHRVTGALQTRSYKIQGGVGHKINSIDISNGAATGLYIVLGSDDLQIGSVKVHKCISDLGFTISDSRRVQVGLVDARDNLSDITIDSGAIGSQIAIATVTDLSKVTVAAGTANIGKLYDITNNKTYSYEKGLRVGEPIAWTPTITSQIPTGTPPTFTVNAASYTRYGRQIVAGLKVTVNTATAGAHYGMQVTLPVPGEWVMLGAAFGREEGATGKMVFGALSAGPNDILLTFYDGSSPIVAGHRLNVQFSYLAADYA